jgi:hypothetical protein
MFHARALFYRLKGSVSKMNEQELLKRLEEIEK